MKQLETVLYTLLIALSLLATACRSAGPPALAKTANSPQDCIQRVIALDDSLGRVRNHACETISLAQTVRNYSDGMQRADFHNCPPAFAEAFERHRQAWISLIPVLEKYPDMRGEMHILFNHLEIGKDAATFNPLLKSVWDTWAEVEAAMKE